MPDNRRLEPSAPSLSFPLSGQRINPALTLCSFKLPSTLNPALSWTGMPATPSAEPAASPHCLLTVAPSAYAHPAIYHLCITVHRRMASVHIATHEQQSQISPSPAQTRPSLL